MHALFRGPRARSTARRLRGLALVGTAWALLSCGVVPHGGQQGAAAQREAGAGRAKALNILLVGLDSRAGLSPETRDRLHVNGKACDCTDVMMLMHVSADRRRVSVVSLPRDSYVRFAPHKDGNKPPSAHRGKINAAHEHGGPSLTVRTVEQATGLRVDHYAETDFADFVKTVDTLGGAKVCTRKPLWDENAGLDITAGTHDFDGRNALRYARARHVTPPGDLGRVRRQQQLVAAILHRLTGERAADDPAALLRTARAFRGTVRTDDGLTARELVRLAGELRGLSPARTEFATVPIGRFDYRVPAWGSTLTWDEPRARAMFRALREDRPLRDEPRLRPPHGMRPVAMEPGLIPVRIEGTGEASLRVRDALRRNGFDVLGGAGGAGGTGGGTGPAAAKSARGTKEGAKDATITYAPGYDREAQVLATALPRARTLPEVGHGRTLTVRPGTGRTELARIVHDRSSVEGAPASAEALACDPTGGHGPR
ncbi:LCP family protein [Streptomyces albiaxialis]|uniref:LCP family protein n=1 Tax=Streptomyces albiaxialis TaxID=329523 RepID=A0ABP5I3I0_9ACTN